MYEYAKNVSIKRIVLIGIGGFALSVASRLCKQRETSVALWPRKASLVYFKSFVISSINFGDTFLRVLAELKYFQE